MYYLSKIELELRVDTLKHDCIILLYVGLIFCNNELQIGLIRCKLALDVFFYSSLLLLDLFFLFKSISYTTYMHISFLNFFLSLVPRTIFFS